MPRITQTLLTFVVYNCLKTDTFDTLKTANYLLHDQQEYSWFS